MKETSRYPGPIFPDAKNVAKGKKRKGPPIIKTGKIEEIAGFQAEQYTRSHKDGRKSEHWLTRELKFPRDFFLDIAPFAGQFADEEMHSKLDQNLWELRKVERWPDGSIWFQREVTKVEHDSLKDDLFIVWLE